MGALTPPGLQRGPGKRPDSEAREGPLGGRGRGSTRSKLPTGTAAVARSARTKSEFLEFHSARLRARPGQGWAGQRPPASRPQPERARIPRRVTELRCLVPHFWVEIRF
ncbi:hypothetical protein TREES_T100007072 [Tupaia chinensis]|uniref:Uncharacterized protein n=1 Tax=Tupaia chinensis TaxID=246437 RepID=L9LBT0_TUPCH|nr:hypothetical protein TREES_T100007072 [Tupaia chinensis]